MKEKSEPSVHFYPRFSLLEDQTNIKTQRCTPASPWKHFFLGYEKIIMKQKNKRWSVDIHGLEKKEKKWSEKLQIT